MASENNFQLLNEQGWRQGFSNMLRKESGEWWHTSRWWKQSLIWLLFVNGILAIVIWVVPILDPEEIEGMRESLGVFTQVLS